MKQLPVFIWLLLAALALLIIARAPPPRNDLTQFLPKASTPEQQQLLEQIRQGPMGRLILLQLSGANTDHLATASKTLARPLQDSGHFQAVINGSGSIDTVAGGLLFEYRYLLTPSSTHDFSSQGLKQALTARLRELSSPLGMPDKKHLPTDPTAAYRTLLQSWRQTIKTPAEYSGVWMTQDHTQALLMLRSRYPAFDLERQQLAINSILDAFAALADSADVQLRMSGAPVFAVESRDKIRHAAQTLSLAAGLGVSLLLLLAFRSVRLMLLAAAPLASGILAGTASVMLLFDNLHGVTLAFGITLIGVAVDYPIHIFTHADGKKATADAVKDIWPIMRLGLLTTLLGFSALLFSDFGGLSQLGVFAVTGLLAAAAFCRFVLPNWAPCIPRGNPLNPLASVLFKRLPFAWLPLLIIMTGIGFIALRGDALWEHELARLSPISAQAKAFDAQLRRELGAPDVKRLLLIRHGDAERVLQLSEQLAARLSQLKTDGTLAAFDLPSRYLPSVRSQVERQQQLPDPKQLSGMLKPAMADLPFKTKLFEPFVQDLARSRELPALRPEQIQNTALAARLETLLNQRGDQWIGLVMLSGIEDEQAINALAKDYAGDVIYLDLARESSRLVAAYRDEALQVSLVTVAIILLTLLVSLHTVRLAMRTAMPVAAAVLGTTALLGLLGQQLSVFHIAALLLVMGIGIDYSLFVTRTPIGHPRFAATTGSLLLCNLSTLLVFGLLASTGIPVLFAIGITVFTGTLLSLLFSAMLVKPTRDA